MDELVLTEEGVFLTTNLRGEIPLADPGTLGLYYQDTRYLSGLEVRVDGAEAPLLGVDDHGYTATLSYGAVTHSPLGTDFPADILLRRTRYISTRGDRTAADTEAPVAALNERISLTSYRREPLDVMLSVAVAADFRDLFHLRGFATTTHGDYGPTSTEAGRITLSYTGRDAFHRYTVCRFDPPPTRSGRTHPWGGPEE